MPVANKQCMKYYLTSVLICILIVLQGCKLNMDRKGSISTSKKSSTPTNQRREGIQAYYKNGNILTFPIKLDVMTPSDAKMDTLISNNPIIGCFPDTSDFYGFLTLSIGDLLYPTIETFDKNGDLIQSEIIATSNCVNPIADIQSCFDSVTITNDLKIETISKLIGTIEDFNDTTENPPNVDFCSKQSINGKILVTGQIELNKTEQTDCDD